MAALILSVLMLAGIAFTAGGIYLLASRRDRKRGGLLLLAAAVLFVNVAIWVTPTESGRSLSDPGADTAP